MLAVEHECARGISTRNLKEYHVVHSIAHAEISAGHEGRPLRQAV